MIVAIVEVGVCLTRPVVEQAVVRVIVAGDTEIDCEITAALLATEVPLPSSGRKAVPTQHGTAVQPEMPTSTRIVDLLEF